MPAVSVIIPTFNRAHCLRTAVDSVLSQSFSDLELIISDDGSTDDTAGLLASYTDSRLKHLKSDSNSGAAAARNKAIAVATSPLIALLDSDDFWLPAKLETHVAWMDSNSGVLAAFTDYQFLRTKNNKLTVRRPQEERSDWAWDLLLYCRAAAGSTLIARVKAFETYGGFDEALQRFEDWDWLLKLAFDQKLAKVPFVGSQITRRGHFSWADLEEAQAVIRQRWSPKAIELFGKAGVDRLQAGRHLQQATSAHDQGNKFATVRHLTTAFRLQPLSVAKFCFSRLTGL
ncbi:glycosyltransferase [Alphaproteobacteria bacterium]|nr:glycosyltransferase [Alphaproteobacteria bacterium]